MNNELVILIKSDLERICKPSLYNFFKTYFFPQGTTFRYQVWLRIMHYSKKCTLLKYTFSPIIYVIFRHYEYKYGIHCNSNIVIGRGLQIVHGDGVYLNCKSIGDNFTVFQNVTLGKSGGGGIPLIKNNVTVYTGAVVTGDIELQDGCTIGALSFVTTDVAASDLVVGAPAKSVRKKV